MGISAATLITIGIALARMVQRGWDLPDVASYVSDAKTALGALKKLPPQGRATPVETALAARVGGLLRASDFPADHQAVKCAADKVAEVLGLAAAIDPLLLLASTDEASFRAEISRRFGGARDAVPERGHTSYDALLDAALRVYVEWAPRSEGTTRAGVLQLLANTDTLLDSTASIRDEIAALHDAVQLVLLNDRHDRQLIVGARPRVAKGFVARDEMAELVQALSADGTATLCALAGMRGVGKSQMASAFSQECEDAGWGFVGWVAASNREQVTAELSAVARWSGVTSSDDPRVAADALVAWLNGGEPGNRLLVFDNVVSFSDVQDLLPRGPGMRVIITSNSRAGALGTPIEVGVFTVDQAIDYLNDVTQQTDRRAASELAEDLGRLPVALAQAAVAINFLELSYVEYRQLLATRTLDDAVRRDPGDSYRDKVGVALRIAWNAVVDRLEADSPAVSEAASCALGALSFLSESGVPRGWLNALTDDPLVMKEAVGELLRSSLLTVSDDGEVVAIHRLQAQVIREDIAAEESTSAVVHLALPVLAAADVENTDHRVARHQCELLVRQLVAITKQPQSRPLVELPDLLSFVRATMFYANGLGNPFLALELADYGPIFVQVLGDDARDTVGFRNNLGHAHELAGHSDLAIALHERTLRDRERILGPDDVETVTSRKQPRHRIPVGRRR